MPNEWNTLLGVIEATLTNRLDPEDIADGTKRIAPITLQISESADVFTKDSGTCDVELPSGYRVGIIVMGPDSETSAIEEALSKAIESLNDWDRVANPSPPPGEWITSRWRCHSANREVRMRGFMADLDGLVMVLVTDIGISECPDDCDHKHNPACAL